MPPRCALKRSAEGRKASREFGTRVPGSEQILTPGLGERVGEVASPALAGHIRKSRRSSTGALSFGFVLCRQRRAGRRESHALHGDTLFLPHSRWKCDVLHLHPAFRSCLSQEIPCCCGAPCGHELFRIHRPTMLSHLAGCIGLCVRIDLARQLCVPLRVIVHVDGFSCP